MPQNFPEKPEAQFCFVYTERSKPLASKRSVHKTKLDGAQLAFGEQAECETRLLWSQLATGNRKGAVAPLHLDVSTLHRETQIQC